MSSGGFLYRKESDLWRKTLRWLGSYEVPAASFRAWDLAKPSLMKCNKPRYSYPPNSSVKPKVSIHSLSPFSITIERGVYTTLHFITAHQFPSPKSLFISFPACLALSQIIFPKLFIWMSDPAFFFFSPAVCRGSSTTILSWKA